MCIYILLHQGSSFPGDLAVKKPHLQCRRCRFDPWSGRSPGRGHGNPVFLPGESHGQKSLAGYSPWGRKESDTPEQVNGRARAAWIPSHNWRETWAPQPEDLTCCGQDLMQPKVNKYISFKKIKYRGFSGCPMVRALHPHCSGLQATQRGQNKNQASCSLDPRRGLGSRVIYSGRSPVLTTYPTGLPRLPTHFFSGALYNGVNHQPGGKKSLCYRSGNPTLTCPLGPNQWHNRVKRSEAAFP